MHNIILIGPMGAGKTTIGKRLAKHLDLTFFDSDQEIEQRTGVDVARIFDIEGEAGFRRRESGMLAELVSRKGVVLATGGGTVLCPDNRALIARSGLVVYLKADVNLQLKRLYRDKKRPLLQTPDRRARMQQLFVQRDPLYAQIADLVIPADGSSISAMVNRVAERLQQHEEPAQSISGSR